MKVRGTKGFTLVELLVAISLGLIVTGAAVAIYQKAQNATMYLTQRSSVQANARTAINQLTQDLNSAGYGLPIGGITVPTAAQFVCSTPGTTYAYSCPTTAMSFPVVPANGSTPAYSIVTGIMPMPSAGPTINGNITDQMMMAYVDSSTAYWSDSCGTSANCGFDFYPLTQAAVSGSTTTLYYDTRTSPLPSDNKWGLKAGDLVLVSNTAGQAVGEVTSVTASNIVLGSGDTMRLNQAYGTSGSVPNVLGFGSGNQSYNSGAGPLRATTITRLYVVSYYAATDPLAQAMGTGANPTRLYRTVNGDTTKNPPVPVAEQVSNLQFIYSGFNTCAGTLSATEAPTINQIGLIKTVNVSLTTASTLNTGLATGQQIQQIPMSTTVSPRNLSYFDNYSSTPQSSC